MGRLILFCLLAFPSQLWAQPQRVVDIPTRPGVTQRMVVIEPEKPKAAVVLFAGGHGGLQISSAGDFKWGEGNFLVRSRRLFSSNGLIVAVVDAPSDHQKPPFLGGFRQTQDHVNDIKAVIAWVKQQANIPIWLVGTSRGTQSTAFIATQLALADGGPDGIVLSSTMLTDKPGIRPVPEMPLEKIQIPVLIVHHKQDGCKHCQYGELSRLTEKLTNTPRKELLAVEGGKDRGDPCEAMAYHGFNGIEQEVIRKIADWIVEKKSTN
ncbi:MAG TPA: alpha/beta hydrolase [Candidatus Andersenbacteria bacterium]|nr:alpha/beta hydrolase [Candidatus Andersenbacteria bacterium]